MGQLDRSNAPPLLDDRIVAFIQSVVSPPAGPRHDHTDGWFQRYCGGLAEQRQAQRYVSAIRRALQLDEYPVMGLRVLEIGCGFGLTSTVLAMMGAHVVHALDSHAAMLATCRSYLKTWPNALPVVTDLGAGAPIAVHGQPLRPGGHGGSAVAFPAAGVQHGGGLSRAQAGGRLVIADDNNALNEDSVTTTRAVWARFENGPPTDDIHGHRVLEPYVDRRQRLVQQAYPELSADMARRIALGTAYMVKDEVLAAAQQFLRDGALPHSHFRADRCPVEPESGQYIENLLDPLHLVQQLQTLGFDARAEAYFGGESRGGVLWATNRLLNDWVPSSLLLPRSEGFRIRAHKRA